MTTMTCVEAMNRLLAWMGEVHSEHAQFELWKKKKTENHPSIESVVIETIWSHLHLPLPSHYYLCIWSTSRPQMRAALHFTTFFFVNATSFSLVCELARASQVRSSDATAENGNLLSDKNRTWMRRWLMKFKFFEARKWERIRDNFIPHWRSRYFFHSECSVWPTKHDLYCIRAARPWD